MHIYTTPMINNFITPVPLSVAIIHCVWGEHDLAHKQTNDSHRQRRHSRGRLQRKTLLHILLHLLFWR